MAEKKPLLSIVVPIYMEQDIIAEFYNRLKAALLKIALGFDYEMMFVNDGSTDRTAEMLKEICAEDAAVKVINFSRNFGHQIAITAGIDHAEGDAVIVMDADLQDPPEIIPQMVSKWKEGYNVVYCVRSKRKGENRLKVFFAAVFYRIISKLSDTKLPLATGDFRLMDRRVVNALKSMREGNRYIRGLVAWIGFSQCALNYERDPRYAGEPKYRFRQSLRLAMDGIASFSEKPLIISSFMGVLFTVISFIAALDIIISKLLNPQSTIQGWASLMVVVLFIGGIQLMSLGIMGMYIGRVYREMKQRPLYIIADKIGFSSGVNGKS
jgi:dolichol-phosphate mannosyltransferase